MTFISFTELGNRIGGLLRGHSHRPCEDQWLQEYYNIVYSARTGAFVVPRFYAEHEFGTQPATAGAVKVGEKKLLYPPLRWIKDTSVEFFCEYWRALLVLAIEHDAVFPIEYALDYPGGENGNPWKGFLKAVEALKLDNSAD